MFFKVIPHNLTYKNRKFLRFFSQARVRVRFAPSPTGFLHLGGLRTALYNALFAKSHQGTFILRIEDTDQTRIVPGAVEQLQNDLTWAGIEINEGPSKGGLWGPYVQSQRLNIYQEHVELLLQSGHAYRCFCTERRLDLLRKEALRARTVPKYDNKCRDLRQDQVRSKIENGDQFCIRFKLEPGEESFNDLIYGRITCDVGSNEGDPVILKSDHFPTYHFANVVDDHLMEISHVLRGVEWQISTPKHIQLYRAFNWNPPQFAHLPLLMNADGTKLSKRQGDIQITHYKNQGILPLALINFITHSGGGFDKDLVRNTKPHCFTIEELARQFDISRVNSHSGRLMSERLLEFNNITLKRYLEEPTQCEGLVREVRRKIEEKFPNELLDIDPERVGNILKWSTSRISTLDDLVSPKFSFIWVRPKHTNIGDVEKSFLKAFKEKIVEKTISFDDQDQMNEMCKEFCIEHSIKFQIFMKTLRSVLSGLKEGPSVAEMMSILGKETSLQRLEQCTRNK